MNVAAMAESVARRKLGQKLDADDEACTWAMERRRGSLTGAVLVSFAAVGRTASGKRIFGTIGDKRARVSARELEAEAQQYEQSTGSCATCLGSGQVVRSISVKLGTSYRACGACAGAGMAAPAA